MSPQVANCFLLLAEAIVYFGVMTTLFRLRDRAGIGIFMCALGVMHFLETYLASVFYVALPFGIVSPGSTVLFSGKLVMLLLLYIKEDASAVRQPIYGLLVGNGLMVLLVLLLRMHQVAPLPNGKTPDIGFIDEMGWLMVWGTTFLYLDSIAIILLYEKLGRWFAHHFFVRVAFASCCVLTFDQIGFFTVLHVVAGAPLQVLVGGWAAKMAAALVFSAGLFFYLRWFEAPARRSPRGLSDIFEVLTYRERYEALVQNAGRDGLTGLLDRGRFESAGKAACAACMHSGKPLSLLIVDVDHFKSINDRFGHTEGDRVLRIIARALCDATGENGHVYRIGGEEFAILSPLPHTVARLLGERIRLAIAATAEERLELTVSIGLASVSKEATGLAALFRLADARLYAAKAGGRNRLVGEEHAAGFPASDRPLRV